MRVLLVVALLTGCSTLNGRCVFGGSTAEEDAACMEQNFGEEAATEEYRRRAWCAKECKPFDSNQSLECAVNC